MVNGAPPGTCTENRGWPPGTCIENRRRPPGCMAAGANAIACVTNTGWQTGDTFLEWLRRNLRNVPNACIVLDLFSAHRFDKTTVQISHEVFFLTQGHPSAILLEKQRSGCHLCARFKFIRKKVCVLPLSYLPGGCTSVVQVMDVYINAPFKKTVKGYHQRWRASEIQKGNTLSKPG